MTPLETILLTYAITTSAVWILSTAYEVAKGEGWFWALVCFLMLAAGHVGLLTIIASIVAAIGIVGRVIAGGCGV